MATVRLTPPRHRKVTGCPRRALCHFAVRRRDTVVEAAIRDRTSLPRQGLTSLTASRTGPALVTTAMAVRITVALHLRVWGTQTKRIAI